MTAGSGKIMWSAKYRAYGNVAKLEISEVENPLRFQGQYFDQETGLHYNRHRYYNPNTGRFLTPDPIKLAGGLNNYQYVPNPTGWVDPLGLACVPGDCPGALHPLTQSQIDEITAIPKGSRPDPSEYLPQEYINSHLAQFKGGASRIMLEDNINSYGIAQRDGTSFVMPRNEVDELIASSGGSAEKLEGALGFPAGFLKDNKLVRVDIQNPLELRLRVPSGNEAGANSLWIPGGKLPGGGSEALVDAGNSSAVKMSTTPIELKE